VYYVGQIDKNGREMWTEVKGFEARDWQIRWQLFNALYPECDKKVCQFFRSSRYSFNGLSRQFSAWGMRRKGNGGGSGFLVLKSFETLEIRAGCR
jgi:hypothetical protein